EAYNNINEAIKYDPENAAYYHERAMLEYYNFENYMAGMEDMKMAHKLNPGNSRYGYILEERWGKELAAKETTKVPAKTEAKKPEIAKTEAEQTEVQQIAKQVKSDILNKYNDNTLMMSFFPTGFFGKIGKRVKAFLTNKPYLSEDKMAKVRTLIDEAANEVATEKLPRSEAKAVVKVRSNFKIYESADFTAQEKLDLIGAKDRKKLADYYYSAYEAANGAENYELALYNINKAIELDPTNANFYHRKALKEYYYFDQKEQAIETMKKAARYNDDADFTLYEDIVKKWSEELKYLKEKQAQKATRQAELKAEQEAARQAELRQQEEARLKAEQEAARQADLARQEEARLKAEQEAARQAELARQEEARLKAEQEAARQAELARQQEAARQADLARQEEARLRAEQEAARQAELARQEEAILKAKQEAARQAKLKAKQEAARQAELARQEEARLRAEQEAARQADFQAELSQRVNEKMLAKDYKGAIEDYNDLIKIDEKGYYYYRRAEAYLKTGQKDLAKADYKKGIELDPRSVLRDSHDFDGLKAELKIEKAQEYSQKAKNSMQRGDNLTAVDFAKTALKYDPSNLEYKTLLDKAEKAVTSEEYYARALEYKKYRHIQLAYKDFEMAINKATDKALKAQYSFEQARLLRYAKGRGKEGHTIHNEKSNHLVSYSEAALRSYDRAVEYAPNNKVKVQYLLERADFKRFNKDFEGAKADTELANKIEKVRTREAERYKAKKGSREQK
ncbi:MAG: tetratricopeptide repeat protein, partial [Elusimicrobiaceae bacterium]|nr:tetratricopeptide repeat protein [Elusimicrobiaceae bacterium]